MDTKLLVSPPVLFATARVVGALWIGGLWALGYAVAPWLFARLPQMIAGALAGPLFALWEGLGLVFGAIVFIAVRRKGRIVWIRVAALTWALDAVFELIILPLMVYVRGGSHFGPSSPEWSIFLGLHAVSAAVYLVEGILGLALIAVAL